MLIEGVIAWAKAPRGEAASAAPADSAIRNTSRRLIMSK
jgi:hypothetical protein